MRAAGELGQVAGWLDSLGELAERHFATIGHSLERAVDILAALAATFQVLLRDLRDGGLAQSGQDLATVAARVGALSATMETDVATLRQLGGVAQAIDGRIARMHAVLQEVEILAMNARLAAATMGAAGIGFLPFAAEIRRSAGAARGGLNLLSRELSSARQHLQVAGQAAASFVEKHAGTMQAIPARLAASVASIEAHVTLSGNAASVVGARSEEIRSQVAAAIVALQVGDITRQRIEHMQSACQLLSQAAVPQALGCRLIAAQLLDTVEELDRGANCIVEQLHKLAADADDIAQQGNQAYGASDRKSGSFLDELEADTHQVETLFEHLRAAHGAVNPHITAVAQAANGLVGHVATIRSVEADIHIMGINTSLKCGRLGVIGRPLSVISQAVRDCGQQTARHAAAVLESLQHLLANAATLAAADTAQGDMAQGDTAQSADGIDAAARRMTRAVRRLGDIGQRMGAALTRLAGDGEAVAQLLHTAVEGFAVQHEIGAVLRDAAAACEQLAEQTADNEVPEAALARIAASYTMAREREVHGRFAPLRGAPATDVPVTADADLADVLF